MMFIEFSVHTLLILYSLCFQIQVIAGGKLMLENRLPYLCGGTFFVLLLRSLRKVHSKIGIKLYSSEGYTQTSLIVALIKLFDSNYRAPKGTSLSTNTSLYKNCSISSAECLPFDDVALINAFDTNVKTNYKIELEQMQILAENFLTIEKAPKNTALVYGLLNLIKEDESILPNDVFYALPNGAPITKSNLLALYDINLHCLLLGVWHYIVVHHHRKNEYGKLTIQSWHTPPSEKGDRHKFISTIGDSYDHEIKISTTCEREDDAMNDYEDDNNPITIPEPEVIESEVIPPVTGSTTTQNIFNISQNGNGINIGYAEKIEIRDGKVVTLK